jgi:hypothetical protein
VWCVVLPKDVDEADLLQHWLTRRFMRLCSEVSIPCCRYNYADDLVQLEISHPWLLPREPGALDMGERWVREYTRQHHDQ